MHSKMIVAWKSQWITSIVFPILNGRLFIWNLDTKIPSKQQNGICCFTPLQISWMGLVRRRKTDWFVSNSVFSPTGEVILSSSLLQSPQRIVPLLNQNSYILQNILRPAYNRWWNVFNKNYHGIWSFADIRVTNEVPTRNFRCNC